MKKIPTFSFTVFIVLIISLIIVFINSDDTFGQTFIEQIRVADSDDTLDTLSDEQLVSLGKAVAPGQFSIDEVKKIINLKRSK